MITAAEARRLYEYKQTEEGQLADILDEISSKIEDACCFVNGITIDRDRIGASRLQMMRILNVLLHNGYEVEEDFLEEYKTMNVSW